MAAMVDYYADFDIGGTGGDGSQSNPWRTWAEIDAGAAAALVATGVKLWIKSNSKPQISTSGVSYDTANGSELNPFVIEGYSSTPGDGGMAKFDLGSYTFTLNFDDCTIMNLHFEGDYSHSSVFRHSSAGAMFIYNCSFVHVGTDALGGSAAAIYNSIVVSSYFENTQTMYGQNGCAAVIGSRSSFLFNTIKSSNIALSLAINYRNQSVIGNLIYEKNASLGTAFAGILYNGKTLNGSSDLMSQNTIYGFEYSVYYIGACTAGYSGGEAWVGNLFAKAQIAAVGGDSFSTSELGFLFLHNAFWGNSSTSETLFQPFHFNTNLSADPFKDAANEDFTLNEVIGGGEHLLGYSMPMGPNMTPSLLDLGAQQAATVTNGAEPVVSISPQASILGKLEAVDAASKAKNKLLQKIAKEWSQTAGK